MSTTDLDTIVGELGRLIQAVDAGALRALEERIASAPRVYVAGAGRTGLVVRAFAMRLMHLGLEVHVVGDVTTPAFRSGDLLVIGSGSGETGGLRVLAERAKALGGELVVMTTVPTSTIGRLADLVVRLDAPSPKATPRPGESAPPASAQPMGSLFEQGLLLVLDAVVMRLAAARGQSSEQMFTRHANLE
ncbi:MAG TPA: 6-phospho-3-hexuloisomerase [Anaeromyxobacter sp.]|nr:6-phospho-3-hexuloisomerase [Anaeromyxobacter sp.]